MAPIPGLLEDLLLVHTVAPVVRMHTIPIGRGPSWWFISALMWALTPTHIDSSQDVLPRAQCTCAGLPWTGFPCIATARLLVGEVRVLLLVSLGSK